MTVSSVWYDQGEKKAQEYEMHFKTARGTQISRVRRELTNRGIEYFQRRIYREKGRWIRKNKIKVRFEREESAPETERTIGIESRSTSRNRAQISG